jgi:hypothetical protein
MPYNCKYISKTGKRGIALSESANGYNKHLASANRNATYTCYIRRRVYNKGAYILYK